MPVERLLISSAECNICRGLSSAGRAPALHAGGQGFDPPRLHHIFAAVPRAAVFRFRAHFRGIEPARGQMPGGHLPAEGAARGPADSRKRIRGFPEAPPHASSRHDDGSFFIIERVLWDSSSMDMSSRTIRSHSRFHSFPQPITVAQARNRLWERYVSQNQHAAGWGNGFHALGAFPEPISHTSQQVIGSGNGFHLPAFSASAAGTTPPGPDRPRVGRGNGFHLPAFSASAGGTMFIPATDSGTASGSPDPVAPGIRMNGLRGCSFIQRKSCCKAPQDRIAPSREAP